MKTTPKQLNCWIVLCHSTIAFNGSQGLHLKLPCRSALFLLSRKYNYKREKKKVLSL